MSDKITSLPINIDVETDLVFRKLIVASRSLAELKGFAYSIPNEDIFLNSFFLQESRWSLACEGLEVSLDDVLRARLGFAEISVEANLACRYTDALSYGYSKVSELGLLKVRTIVEIYERLLIGSSEFREQNVLLDIESEGVDQAQELTMRDWMTNLEGFTNNINLFDFDPLIKLGFIYAQFERLAPFEKGNSLMARLVAAQYPLVARLLDFPILGLSEYFGNNIGQYQKALVGVKEHGEWEAWVIFVLEAIDYGAKKSCLQLSEIRAILFVYKKALREGYKFYSQSLLNNLFKNPYTKIEYVQEDLGVSRITAARYLNILAEDGLLRKRKLNTGNFYVNERLVKILDS